MSHALEIIMKLRHIRPNRIHSALLALAMLSAANYAHAACPSGPGNACPIKAGPVVAFDQCFLSNPLDPKPTNVGKDACRALSDAEKLGEALGANANRFAQDAARQMDSKVKAANIAIATELQDTVRDSQRFFLDAQKQALALANDRQCGVNSTLKTVQSALNDDWGKLQTLLATAPKLVQLLELTGQVAARSGQLSQSLAAIGSDVAKGGSQAQTEFNKLKSAADTFDKSVKEVLGSNPTNTITQTVTDITRLGATLGTAGACATTVAAGIASVGSGSVAAGGGATSCAPSEGIGCVVALAGGAIGGIGAALSSGLAGPACSAMAVAAGTLAADVAALERLINGAANAVNGVVKAGAQMQDAALALAKLAETMPRESEANLRRLAQDINAIGGVFETAQGIIGKDLVPTYTRITQQLLTDTVGRVQLAYTCFDKAVDVGADLGMDFVDLLKDHNLAAQAVLDAGKIAGDLQKRLARAGDAAEDAAKHEWDKLKAEDRRLHREIWGVNKGTTDFARTGAHLVSLAGNPGKVADIADDLGKMLGKEVRLVAIAVDAASDALLAPDKLKPFNDKHTQAKAQAKQAAIEIAKAKARASMVAKAKQTHLKVAAGTVRTVQAATINKITVPDLKVASKFTGKTGG
jgi:hypothetical protein